MDNKRNTYSNEITVESNTKFVNDKGELITQCISRCAKLEIENDDVLAEKKERLIDILIKNNLDFYALNEKVRNPLMIMGIDYSEVTFASNNIEEETGMTEDNLVSVNNEDMFFEKLSQEGLINLRV